MEDGGWRIKRWRALSILYPLSSILSFSWLRVALSLYLVLGVAVSIRTVVRPESHTVFPIFAEGAMHWWHGESLYAYYSPLDSFRYSPTFALAMTPFARLGNVAGGITWSWLNIAIYVWGLRRLVRDVLPGAWPPAREAALLSLALVGALRSVWNAQGNPLVIGLLMLAAAALARRRWWLAAFLLTGPVFLKLTPIAVAMLFCAMWPRVARAVRACSGHRCSTAFPDPAARDCCHAIPGMADTSYGLGERAWDGFRDGWTVWVLVHNLVSQGPELNVFKEPIHSAVYRALQFLAAGGALVWCLWQQRRLTTDHTDDTDKIGLIPGENSGLGRLSDMRELVTITLGIGMAWLMIFGPAVEFPTYVFLAPLVSWGVLESGARRHGVILAVAAWLLTTIVPYVTVSGSGPVSFLLAALPCGTALFAIWLLRYKPRQEEAIRQSLAWSVAA